MLISAHDYALAAVLRWGLQREWGRQAAEKQKIGQQGAQCVASLSEHIGLAPYLRS
jgi:hypothetical protein